MVAFRTPRMHPHYIIAGAGNICRRELEGPEYNDPAFWPSFQSDWIALQSDIISCVEGKAPKLYLRIFDGEFWFLKGQKVGNVGSRHCSKPLTPEFLKPFYEGFLKADIVSTQLYADQMKIYKSLFPSRPFEIPMELLYCLVSTRWIFRQFPDSIALIGGNGKMRLIQELMKYEEYRNYLGVKEFTDYISVPERFACDDTEAVFEAIRPQIEASKATVFLFGMGISKLAIAHRFKTVKNAVFLDVGCGITALAGTTSIERPYFGEWTNYRLRHWDYSGVDPIDFRDTPTLNVKMLP